MSVCPSVPSPRQFIFLCAGSCQVLQGIQVKFVYEVYIYCSIFYVLLLFVQYRPRLGVSTSCID